MAYLQNPLVHWLLVHSYGQKASVFVPTKKSNTSFTWSSPAGVQDVLERIVDVCADWPTNKRGGTMEWCLLIGGPGNGKSKALNDLADLLQINIPQVAEGRPAPRCIPDNWPNSASAIDSVPDLEMMFINDASIPHKIMEQHNFKGSLLYDLINGIQRLVSGQTPLMVFGNVNRGILIEERSAIDAIKSQYPGEIAIIAGRIVEWLLDPESLDDLGLHDVAKTESIITTESAQPYYSSIKLNLQSIGSAHDLIIHAVFLDTLSLLEPSPSYSTGKCINFSSDAPDVEHYRTFGGFADDVNAERETYTVAGEILVDITSTTQWQEGDCRDSDGQICDAYTFCPFAQNVRWLQDTKSKRAFLDLYRATEVTAGQRFTYRDLLAHYSKAVIGDVENDWLQGQHPCDWVRQNVDGFLKQQDWSNLGSLAGHRIYINMFPVTDPLAWKNARESARSKTIFSSLMTAMTRYDNSFRAKPFERAFNLLDPARDVDDWHGSREYVTNAVEALEIELPHEYLLTEGLVSHHNISDIERNIDQCIRDEIFDELKRGKRVSAIRANLLRKWSHTVWLRQVGMSNGYFSFKDALTAWLQEQSAALRELSADKLEPGIRELLLPSDNQFFLAPLRPRTFTLDNEQLPSSTLLTKIDVRNLEVYIETQGDYLIARMYQLQGRNRPELVASLVVDISITREALFKSDNTGNSFTEISASAFARIERVRASLVGRQALSSNKVYFTTEQGHLFEIDALPFNENQFRITGDQ